MALSMIKHKLPALESRTKIFGLEFGLRLSAFRYEYYTPEYAYIEFYVALNNKDLFNFKLYEPNVEHNQKGDWMREGVRLAEDTVRDRINEVFPGNKILVEKTNAEDVLRTVISAFEKLNGGRK